MVLCDDIQKTVSAKSNLFGRLSIHEYLFLRLEGRLWYYVALLLVLRVVPNGGHLNLLEILVKRFLT